MHQQKILYNESVTKREAMEFDGALIDALRDNGRLPVTELARRLQLPRRRVQERMHSLLESGTIRIVANVHPALLGIHLFCDVLIWIDGPSAPVLAHLRGFRETTFITAVAGNCDIVVEVGAKDQAHLEHTLAKIRSTPGVRETASSQLVHIFKSRFETDNGLARSELYQPDQLDTRIIEVLGEDGRMPYRELGQEVGLSIGAVRARLGKLMESGMLRIACEVEESSTARRMQMGASLRLGGESSTVVESLCAMQTVEFGAIAIGNFDVVLTLSGTTLQALHRTLDELRSLDEVSNVTSWMHLDVVRESYE